MGWSQCECSPLLTLHSMHVPDCAAEYVPGLHSAHEAAPIFENWPAWQSAQLGASSELAYWPGGQNMQFTAAASEYEPARQLVQDERLGTSLWVPGWQSSQTLPPSFSWYVPTSQSTQPGAPM